MLQCFQEVVSPACLLQHGTPPGRPLVSLRCASLSSADCPAALECSRTPPSAFGKSRNPRQIAYRRPHPLCSGSNTASTVTSTDTRFRYVQTLTLFAQLRAVLIMDSAKNCQSGSAQLPYQLRALTFGSTPVSKKLIQPPTFQSRPLSQIKLPATGAQVLANSITEQEAVAA